VESLTVRAKGHRFDASFRAAAECVLSKRVKACKRPLKSSISLKESNLVGGRIEHHHLPSDTYARRKVPLSEGMARELEARWLLVDDVEGPVFSSTTGTVIDSSKLMSRVLKPAGRRAGVPWVGFHTFRHTCATTFLRRGLNAKQARIWLGDHSPSFTLATYVHFLDDDLPSADFLDGVTESGNNGNRVATSPTETEFGLLEPMRAKLPRLREKASASFGSSESRRLLMIRGTQVRILAGPSTKVLETAGFPTGHLSERMESETKVRTRRA
jgi:hypothetical protein